MRAFVSITFTFAILSLLGCTTFPSTSPHGISDENGPVAITKSVLQNDYRFPEFIEASLHYDLYSEEEPAGSLSHHLLACWEKVLNQSMVSMKYEFFYELCFPPLGPEFHFKRGLIMDILNYNDLALIEYSRAIDQNPTDALYYNNRANIYQAIGYAKRAIEDLDVAISLNPYKAELYLNRAKAKKAIGDFEGAQMDYGHAIELGICERFPTLRICTERELYTRTRGR